MHPMQVARLVNSGIRLARNPMVREVAKQITKETTTQAVIRAGQSVKTEMTDPGNITSAGRQAIGALRNKENLGKKATKFVAGVGGGTAGAPIGTWLGGVIGGLIGGPPGAAIGVAVGPWVGRLGGSVATDALIDSTWQD